jgi:hypothetical protein
VRSLSLFATHFSGANNDRWSWDPATTLYAARGASGFYTEHSTGHNDVGYDGNNRWIETGASVNQSYLVLKSNASAQLVRDAIDTLLVWPPRRRAGRELGE